MIDLSEPILTEEAKNGMSEEMYAPMDMEGRDVAATICRIPHSVMFNGRVLQMSMLSHACTMPNYRNEGRMKKMIDAGTPLYRAVCDYIASMTDRYAIKMFESIYIPRNWDVI